jgi:indolepyruvate decarboxylase
MLSRAKNPMILAGVEIHRFRLQKQLLELLERSRFPFVTGILGKSVVSENHPQFVGVYAGAMSPDDILQKVEGADSFLVIGALITDLSTGMFTHHIDPARVILLMPDSLMVGSSSYPGIDMKYFLDAMSAAMPEQAQSGQPVERHTLAPFVPEKGKRITVERLMACANTFLSDDTTVIAETGDSLFGALDLRVHAMNEFMAGAYYASLGFGVPASIGVQLAAPNRRPLVLEGDGSFQMTGMELSTAARYGLSPIVVILNNGGYGIFRPLLDGAFNDIQPWQYAEVVRVIGSGKGFKVSKEEELADAFEAAMVNTASPTIIDVVLDKYDCSERLKRLTQKWKTRVK